MDEIAFLADIHDSIERAAFNPELRESLRQRIRARIAEKTPASYYVLKGPMGFVVLKKNTAVLAGVEEEILSVPNGGANVRTSRYVEQASEASRFMLRGTAEDYLDTDETVVEVPTAG